MQGIPGPKGFSGYVTTPESEVLVIFGFDGGAVVVVSGGAVITKICIGVV
jgi:hypothetical protein